MLEIDGDKPVKAPDLKNKDFYRINVITSDITYMKDTFCIAGLCPSAAQMRRLLINGRHWTDDDLRKIGRYSLLNVEVTPHENGRGYPHKTEDTHINEDFKVIRYYDDQKRLVKDLHPSISKTIESAFHGNLRKKSYVAFDTKCPSLGAVVLTTQKITFLKKDGKLRTKLIDHDSVEYDLRITCKYLRDLLDPMSVQELEKFNTEMKSTKQKAHVRVGLARPYKDNHCYLMCNGIFFYDD